MTPAEAPSCPARRRARRSDGERTRAAIAQAALALISEQGLAGTTQRGVAKRAGVSLAAVTYHYPALADLFDAAFERLTDESVAQLRRLREAAHEGRTTLEEAWGEVVRDERGRTRTHVIGAFELLVSAVREPRLRPAATRLLDALNVFFQAWTPGTGPARSVLSLMLGLSLTEAASGNQLSEGDIEAVLSAFSVQPDLPLVPPDRGNPAPQHRKDP